MEKLRKAKVSHFARRLAVFTAAGLLLVEGCACTKQYKGANINGGNMAYGERILTPQKVKGGEDSLKVVPKKLTPEEKMKARLKEINKTLDSIAEDEYNRIKDMSGKFPAKNYRQALVDLMFLGYEKDLYTAALNHDAEKEKKAKADIKEWGETTNRQVDAIKILDTFEANSR